MIRLKVFTEASPKELEKLFNTWATPEINVLTTQIEYSPALQKFILCTTYIEGGNPCPTVEEPQKSRGKSRKKN